MSSTIGGVRIVDMPDLGAFSDDSSLVGEHAGSGRFGATALRSYVSTQFMPLAGGTMVGDLTLAHDPVGPLVASTKQYVDTNVFARPYVVPTIAALRALSTYLVSNVVWVGGYSIVADGGEGMFEYVATDTTGADNGGTVIVDTVGRRWYRQGLRGEVTVKQFGAKGDGTTDDTARVQAAINYMGTQGGGIVRVTQGNYRIVGNFLTIAASNIKLVGDGMYASVFTFANGALNCINVGGLATIVSDVVVSTLSIIGSGKTDGVGISAFRHSYCQFDNLNISGVPNGITVQILNNVWIDKCQIVCTTSGFSCINWQSPANDTDRSDVLTITDTVVNAQGHGQYGLHIDGMCQTLRVSRLGIIHCGSGMLVENTAGSSQYFPQFIYCDDMEIDGVDTIGLHIAAGRQMHFVNTTVFNAGGSGADTNALYINSDGAHSITNYIGFTNCAFAGAHHEGVICNARQVDFVNCYIGDNSVAGLNAYDGVVIADEGTGAGPAGSISFTGGRIGSVYGDLPNQRYGISVGAGCARITITGVDFTNCATRAINDGSGGNGNVMWHGCVGINGVPLPDRLQQVATDPSGANLVEGMMWENVSSSTLKVCLNGVVKTVTVT